MREMALTAQEKKLTQALYALKQIGNHIGMYGRLRNQPTLTESDKYLCLGAVAVIIHPNQPLVAKMACSLILDYLLPEWREITGNEAVGYIIDRNDKEVRKWRNRVMKRDNHKCAECESVDNLEVHHIAHWAEFPELRLADDNGTTLCNSCHAEQHENSNFILSRVG